MFTVIAQICCFIDVAIDMEAGYRFHGMDASGDFLRFIQEPKQTGASQLRLVRDFGRGGEVFLPHTNLVVSERLHLLLAHLPQVAWRKVALASALNTRYPLRGPQRLSFEEVRARILRERDDPSFRVNLGDYYELLVHNAERLPAVYRPQKVHLQFSPGALALEEEFEMDVHLFRSYPVLWRRNAGTMIRDDVFEMLRPFLDMRFFTRAHFGSEP